MKRADSRLARSPDAAFAAAHPAPEHLQHLLPLQHFLRAKRVLYFWQTPVNHPESGRELGPRPPPDRLGPQQIAQPRGRKPKKLQVRRRRASAWMTKSQCSHYRGHHQNDRQEGASEKKGEKEWMRCARQQQRCQKPATVAMAQPAFQGWHTCSR